MGSILSDVATRMIEGYYKVEEPVLNYIKEGTIIDSLASPEDNVYMVREHNNGEDLKLREYKNKQGDKDLEKTKDLIRGIKEYSRREISEAKAKVIINFVGSLFNESDVDDYMTMLYETIDFVNELMDVE